MGVGAGVEDALLGAIAVTRYCIGVPINEDFDSPVGIRGGKYGE